MERRVSPNNPKRPATKPTNRRGFLRAGAAIAGGVAAAAAALSPLRKLGSADIPNVEKFLQKHYKEMTPEEMTRVLERITAEV